MIIRASRARRRRVAVVSALAVMAIGAPSASAATDTTPPSPPGNAGTAFDDRCTATRWVHWSASTDNVDAPSDLRYRFYDAQGKAIVWGRWEGQTTDIAVTGAHWVGSLPEATIPVTVRAVDRAGNLSAAVPVKNEGLMP